MSECPQCAVAAVKAKASFNRVCDATMLKGGVNRLPNGDIDWDSFRKAVDGALGYALAPSKRKRKG